MKILKIRFENINSLKSLHEIDFTRHPLSTAGLFAITGPTGTGKTTILDVITLALFDRIPRVDEKISKGLIEKTGLILTRNMRDCFAEVTYECKKGVFTSKWGISRAKKTGNLQEYEMELSDSKNNILPLRKAEVPPKNEELIGLNFDQFVKAIILAQGDFAAFLKARGDERGKLLEQVTGSWIYRELGKAAYNKNKLSGQELERLQLREGDLMGRLMDESTFALLVQELADCEKAREGLNLEIRRLGEQKKLKEDISTLQSSIASAEKEESRLVSRQGEFVRINGKRLEKHRKLMPFNMRLWNWQQMGKTVSDNADKLLKITRDLVACDNMNTQIEKEVLDLTGSSDEIQSALDAFEKKVLAIEKEKGEKDALIRSKGSEAVKSSAELGLKPDISNPVSVKKIAGEVLSEKESAIEELKSKLGPELLASPETSEGILRAYNADAGLYSTEKARLDIRTNALEKELVEIALLNKSVQELPGQIETAKEAKARTGLILDNLNKEKRIRELSASLEDHRKRLREGEPCPLCGSLEHPYRDKGPVFADDLDKKIKEADEANEKHKKEFFSLEALLKQHGDEQQKKKETVGNLNDEINKLSSACKIHLLKLPEKYRSMEPQAIIDTLRSQIDDLVSYISASSAKSRLNDLIGRLSELIKLANESSELLKNRSALFAGDDIRSVTGSIMKRYTENRSSRDKYLKDKDELAVKAENDKRKFSDLENELKQELPAYQDIRNALEDIIAGTEYEILNKEEERLRTGLIEVRAGLNAGRQSLKEMRGKDIEKTSDEIKSELEDLNTRLAAENSRRDLLAANKKIHDKAREELVLLLAEIESQRAKNEKWVLLNKYIGDAEGKKFSTFAQQLTLFQLVKLANKRLKMLSDRYQLDIPEEDKDDSLDVIDTHMGDLRRSVKSLSGGESFLVSLSLALALSDLASRQVDIKSLFIDEGFGSLDKLSLDQTIDTLEKLQYETSKTIGVISHIEAMQERISTQIRLSRNGQGYSGMEIVQ